MVIAVGMIVAFAVGRGHATGKVVSLDGRGGCVIASRTGAGKRTRYARCVDNVSPVYERGRKAPREPESPRVDAHRHDSGCDCPLCSILGS